MIITVGSSKGGVGKSTIACNLAVMAALDNKKVLLVDTDPQASSLAFRASREKEDLQAIQITTPTVHKDLSSFNNYDMIIVDSGGRNDAVFRSSIMASDLLLIPCLPSTVDFWAVSDVLKILDEAIVFKEIKAFFLLNQVIPKTIVSAEMTDSLKELNSSATLLNIRICSRVVYKNSFDEGKGVVEMKDPKAIKEMGLLYDEIKEASGEK